MGGVKSKKKPVCPECGVPKRPNTLFCYACGSRVAEGPVTIGALPEPNGSGKDQNTPARAALDDLADKFKIEPPDDDKLARAAAERKMARVANRPPKVFQWEEAEESGDRMIVLLAVLIFVIATAVVMLTVVWK